MISNISYPIWATFWINLSDECDRMEASITSNPPNIYTILSRFSIPKQRPLTFGRRYARNLAALVIYFLECDLYLRANSNIYQSKQAIDVLTPTHDIISKYIEPRYFPINIKTEILEANL